MPEFSYAPEVATIAAELIAQQPMHGLLSQVRIDYVFRDKAAKSHGRVVLGRARKVGGLNAFLIRDGEPDPMFVIEVAEDEWLNLDDDQRRALVDHELCHCQVTEGEEGLELAIRGHDLEEFTCIVERHGMWKQDVRRFGSVIAEQMAMAVEEAVTYTGDDGPPLANEDGEPL